MDKSQARAACDVRDGGRLLAGEGKGAARNRRAGIDCVARVSASGAAATKPFGKFQIPANGKTPYADGMKFAISVSPFFGNATQVNSLWAKCPIEMVLVP